MKIEDRFYYEMITYLTDNSVFEAYCKESDPDKPLYHLPYDILDNNSKHSFEDTMCDILECFLNTPFLDKKRYEQYKIIEKLAETLSIPTQQFFQFLFTLSETNVMSWPAYGVLYNYYGDILEEITKTIVLTDLSTESQTIHLKSALYKVLSNYILKNISLEEIVVYEGDYYHEEDEEKDNSYLHDEPEEGTPWEEYERLECCVFRLNKRDFKHHRDNQYIVAFANEELNEHSTLIGNMITFVNQNNADLITYMIVDRQYYPTCKEMFSELGTKPFGYSRREANGICAMTKFINAFCLLEGMVALKVKKLPIPILEKDSFRLYCR